MCHKTKFQHPPRGGGGRGGILKTPPRPKGHPPPQGGEIINLKDTNWISKSYPLKAKSYSCQIRYHSEFLSCKIKCATSDVAQVIFKKPVLVASGQSCVIYDKNVCLGGGVVI